MATSIQRQTKRCLARVASAVRRWADAVDAERRAPTLRARGPRRGPVRRRQPRALRHRRLELPPDRRSASSFRATSTTWSRPSRSAASYGAPICRRGGGTEPRRPVLQRRRRASTCSKYMNRVLDDRSATSGSARVQPGTSSTTCGTQAEPHGLTFGPDPVHAQPLHARRHDRQQLVRRALGDGAVHGPGPRTSDSVESLDILTYDGTRLTVGATTDDELRGDHPARRPRAARSTRAAARSATLRATRSAQRMPAHPAPRLGLQPRRAAARARLQRRARAGRHRGHLRHVLEATLRLIPNPPARIAARARLSRASTRPPTTCRRSCEHRADRLRGHGRRARRSTSRQGLRPPTSSMLPEGQRLAARRVRRRLRRTTPTRRRTRLMAALRASARRADDEAVRRSGEQEHEVWKVREAGLGATAHVAAIDRRGRAGRTPRCRPRGSANYLRDSASCSTVRLQGDALRPLRPGLRPHAASTSISQPPTASAATEAFLDEARRPGRRASAARCRASTATARRAASCCRKMFGAELDATRSASSSASGIPRGKMNPGKVVDALPPRREPAARHDYNPPALDDALPLPERQRQLRERDAALRRRRRVPPSRGRHDVPELHGDARGEALDARPRAAAVRDARRAIR